MLELPVDETKDVEFRNDGLNLDWRARSQMTTITSFELDHLENDHDAFTLANNRDHGSPGIALDTNTRSCRPAFRQWTTNGERSQISRKRYKKSMSTLGQNASHQEAKVQSRHNEPLETGDLSGARAFLTGSPVQEIRCGVPETQAM